MALVDLGSPCCLFLRIQFSALLAKRVVHCQLESSDALMLLHYSNHMLMNSCQSLLFHCKHMAMPDPVVVRLPLHLDISQLAQAESQWTLGSNSGW